MTNLPAVAPAWTAWMAVCCLTISVASSSRAEEGKATARTLVGELDGTAPSASPCVLLRNDNVLFGEARQVGEFVVVQTGKGGEIKLHRQDVLCWAGSLRNLYRYRVDHRQPGDLSALIRDARWSLRYDLYDLAAQEIRSIYAIDPNNVEARSLENHLRRQFAAATASTATRADNPERQRGQVTAVNQGDGEEPPIRIVGYNGPRHLDDGSADSPSALSQQNAGSPGINEATDHMNASGDDVSVDLSTLRRFVSHVQPMLTNRCGRCHDASLQPSLGWTIELPAVGARASSRMTRDNLRAAVAYIDSTDPEQSDLLLKATSAHGGYEAPPLDARDAKAIESLRSWLWMAAGSLLPTAPDPPVAASVGLLEPGSDPESASRSVSQPESLGHALRQRTDPHQSAADESSAEPLRLPVVDNPFDPELFNRRFHPDSENGT